MDCSNIGVLYRAITAVVENRADVFVHELDASDVR